MSEARVLALFVACLGPSACALLAWMPATAPGPPLFALTLALAGALACGEAFEERMPALRERGAFKLRAWVLATACALALMIVVFAALAPRPALLFRQTLLLLTFEATFLLLPALGPGRIPALGVALSLVILAAFRGGIWASVAVLSYFVGLMLFMGHDHFERRLLHHPPAKLRLARAALGESVGAAAAGITLLVAWFFLAPPRAHAGLDAATLEALLNREKMVPAYLQLAFVALVGAGGVYYVSRLLRRRRGGKPSEVEMVLPERGREEVLRREPRGRPDYSGARGAVVRAYVSFLREAAGRVLARRPDQTALEIAGLIREPGGALSRLTELFGNARYGPREPDASDVRAAESLGADLREWLRARGETRRA